MKLFCLRRPMGITCSGLVALALLVAFQAGAAPVASVDRATAGSERVEMLLQREIAGIDGRVEIRVGQLDLKMNLAPCAEIEPFLPSGTKPWGKILVGMRCRSGAVWTVFLPVTVSVFGSALTAKRNLAYGTTPTDADVETVETELSREPGVPVTDMKQLDGKSLARPLLAGQILRREHFKAAPVIAQGDQVKLVASGAGFTIAVDGEALTYALDGQNIRVRTDSGRIVSGTARPGRLVELHIQ